MGGRREGLFCCATAAAVGGEFVAVNCLAAAPLTARAFFVAFLALGLSSQDLRKRVRHIAGVPCMYIAGRKYTVERMPEAFGAPKT